MDDAAIILLVALIVLGAKDDAHAVRAFYRLEWQSPEATPELVLRQLRDALEATKED